jgi:DNA-binding beta-propeller fold protein YncE
MGVVLAGAVLRAASAVTEPANPRTVFPSPAALVATRSGDRLFVATQGTGRVTEFALPAAAPRRTWELGPELVGMVLSADENRLLAVEAAVEGRVHVLSVAGRRASPATVISVGHFPSAVALSRDQRRLYVARRFQNTIAEFSFPDGRPLRTCVIEREPIALALTANDQRLLVATHLPTGPATADHVAAAVAWIELQGMTVAKRIALPNGSMGVRGLALAPDGSAAYVPHVLGRFQQPTNRIERGWMNTNALSVFDLAAESWSGTVLLDRVEAGAANPWGAACSTDGRWLAVTHAGSHELSVIDRPALHAALRQDPEHRALDQLAFLQERQRRVPLPVQGPRAVAVAGNQAWIAGFFSHDLTRVDLASRALPASPPQSLGPVPALTAERRGEIAFHDATHCFQRWQSCSSCHPDARVDGLNWDLMNDGVGNPKSTKSMLLAHRTPPAMWLGVRPDAPYAVRSGFKHIQFAAVDEAHAADVDRYLQALAPVPSPHLVRSQLSAAAERGRRHFKAAGCADCHAGPHATDLRSYDVGTTGGRDRGQPVDTPALVECWRTAPYLHDGSAATLRDVLLARNPGGSHAEIGRLSPVELEELIAFVLSL